MSRTHWIAAAALAATACGGDPPAAVPPVPVSVVQVGGSSGDGAPLGAACPTSGLEQELSDRRMFVSSRAHAALVWRPRLSDVRTSRVLSKSRPIS